MNRIITILILSLFISFTSCDKEDTPSNNNQTEKPGNNDKEEEEKEEPEEGEEEEENKEPEPEPEEPGLSTEEIQAMQIEKAKSLEGKYTGYYYSGNKPYIIDIEYLGNNDIDIIIRDFKENITDSPDTHYTDLRYDPVDLIYKTKILYNGDEEIFYLYSVVVFDNTNLVYISSKPTWRLRTERFVTVSPTVYRFYLTDVKTEGTTRTPSNSLRFTIDFGL